MIASTIANVNRPKGKAAYKVDAFKPRFGPRRQATNEELLAKAVAINAALGGIDMRNQRDGNTS